MASIFTMNTPLEMNLFFPIDEDGFIALVCPDSYTSFVADNWTLTQVSDHFVEQMNLGNAFIACPGDEAADEVFALVRRRDGGRVIREASGRVRVGDAGLWLTSYLQLSTAAQFEDQLAADPRNSLRLPCAPGLFRVTVRELAGVEPPFELEIRPDGTPGNVHHDAVPWFDL